MDGRRRWAAEITGGFKMEIAVFALAALATWNVVAVVAWALTGLEG